MTALGKITAREAVRRAAHTAVFDIARLVLGPGDTLVVRGGPGWSASQQIEFERVLNTAPALAAVAGRVVVLPHDASVVAVLGSRAEAKP